MQAITTILTAAAFLAHAFLGCGCQHAHAHNVADRESEQHVCGGHHDGDQHHHASDVFQNHGAQNDGDDQLPSEHRNCQCSHVGCVYVVGPKVKSTADLDVVLALVDIAPTSAAALCGSDVVRRPLQARGGPPRSLRSHLQLQILLV
jgi:hypothetical protein